MKFNWPLKSFNEELSNNFSFYKNFPDVTKSLFCGKFNRPVVLEDGIRVEANKDISFIDFKYDQDDQEISIFFPGNNSILPDQVDLEFTMIEPHMTSETFLFNSISKNANNLLYAHLFYREENGANTYLSSISGQFHTFYAKIKKALEDKYLCTFGIAVVLQCDDESNESFKAANCVLTKKYKGLDKMMNILIKSSSQPAYSYKDKLFYYQDVREALKEIFLECSKLLRLNISDKVNTLCRRIVINCLNGGLPLSLFDELKDLIHDESKWNYCTRDFEYYMLNFESFRLSGPSINEELKVPIHNIMYHLFEDSKESQFRSMFWDQSEWNTKELFNHLENRSVDYVALFQQSNRIEIPIFLSEIGYSTFGIGIHSHKDFSKLLAIMSQSCIKMAKQLEKDEKRAEDAVVFGTWIGGPQLHLVTTRAFVTAIDGHDSFQVHAHSAFPPEWKFNLLTSNKVEENIEQSNPVPSIESATSFSSTVDMLYLDSDSEQENISEDSEFKKKLLDGEINSDTLINLRSFVGHIVKHIEYLKSPESNRVHGTPPRTFKCPDDKGVFQSARASSMSETPSKEKLTKNYDESGEEYLYPSTPTPRSRKLPSSATNFSFGNDGRPLSEVQLYRKFLCHSPEYFPEVYSIDKEPGSNDKYEILTELMSYFVDPYTRSVSDRLWFSGLEHGLIKGLNFALQLLNSLDWLHSIFKTVHSDISPYNIMFSDKYDSWKFIDFEYSMDINLSRNTKRQCGTRDYIAVESQESGIYTEASDIFSLGTIFLNYLWPPMIYRTGNRSSLPSQTLQSLINEFERIIFQMTKSNPKERPSAFDAMMAMFDIVQKMPKTCFDFSHPAFERIKVLYEEKKQLESIELGIENIEIETELVKRTKLETSAENLEIIYSVKVIDL